ncbi:SAV_2336 N-terminal domain-related protein [Streptomyces collinus]|uniref:Beta-phosphoglucomutase-like phosphatase (HAD superfamily) n=1 Tax=Streptomyces collinus TaxID=42684 RepID=A0AA89Q0W6_STRCU|nr:SAV_2336 N-terminal domain-related protein [Streptomyces collinus]MBB5810870.1 beta-phosphoglucomutase-like phosphatase (HAD superfamily) [Streptomyces collinus]WMX64133.1 SAV_2336 N-terminal domain-related protein [Streptomyces collinus]
MASDGGPGPSPVARLQAALSAAGAAPTPREIAELLWLAGQLDRPSGEPRTGRPTAPEAPVTAGAATGPEEPAAPEAPQTAEPSALAGPGRVPLRLPAPRSPDRPGHHSGGGSPLLAPAPPMLPHPLALQRALRPLQRKVPSPHLRLLDERATADRIARLGAHPDVWFPVLRPAPDRWLRLNLVHDTGPTMPVWRPLVSELHTALAQSGIFRTVTLHPATPDGRARQVPVLDDGRTATLVVSDCMGPQWRPGEAGERWYRTLRQWAHRMPLAVVQPLPEHLWAGTALPAEPGLLTSPSTAAPSAALAFTPYDATSAAPDRALPLPVLEPGAPWLAHWAALLADPGGARTPGAVAWLPPAPAPPAEPTPDITTASPEDLVLRFRATASPEAFRLAGHLALAVPSVPVMRLVQRTLERDPRPQHLAEVILSGMLTSAPGPPGSYAFRPGVRELLLRSLPRTARGRTREFLERVGGLIDERAGFAAGEFRAETDGGKGDAGPAFATVSEETVRRLGGETLFAGRYRLTGRRDGEGRVSRAVDVRTGRQVIVRRYREQPAPQERFLNEARALAGVDDPHVVKVLDFGVESDAPYLVTEFVDGLTVSEVLSGITFPAFARLVCQGMAGLEALHARGLARGERGPDGLLLRPDGTVLLSRVTLGEESRNKAPEADVAEFRWLLKQLVAGTHVPAEHRELLELIDRHELREAAAYAARLPAGWPPPRSFALLGPLRISAGPEPVAPPSPEARALLCMLLLRHGRRVPHSELARGLWEEPLPESEAAHRLDALAAEVRQVLPDGGLVAFSDSYALHVPDLYVDVLHCEELLSDRMRGSTDLRRVLGLWYGDPLDGVPGPAAAATRDRLRALLERLRKAVGDTQEAAAPTILFEADDLTGHPEARITLEYAVHEMLSRGALAPHQFDVRVRSGGYDVHTEPGTYLLPVLAAVLRGLPEVLTGLVDPPPLTVTFWDRPAPPPEPPRVPADIQVIVSPDLYEQFAASSAAQGPQRFQPLFQDGATDTPPVAWYCPLSPATAPEPGARDLVQGPFITRDLRRLGIPAPGRTAVVHTRPDGPLTLLNPARPHGGRPPGLVTYYEVDLTTHQSHHRVSLPSSGKGAFAAAVELAWHVEDPVAFVRAETGRVSEVLLGHLLEEAARITRRHPLRRAGAAQRAVSAALRHWPVPGLSVTASVQLDREGATLPEPQGAAASQLPLPRLLGEAETVLVGFDGPMARLFSASTAREAVLGLLALADEHRAPGQALPGAVRETFAHPLDVLRAFAQDPLGPLLRERLDEIELRAVPHAPATHNSAPLVRTLHASGRRVCVITDVCAEAVPRYLRPYGALPLAGVHGRAEDLALLTPHPDCMLRALDACDGSAATGLVIGSTVAELAAAQRAGLRFVGLARNATTERQLREAGCETTVTSLAPLLEAARSL